MSKKKSGSIGKKLGSVVAQQLKKSTEQAAKSAYEQQAGQEMTSAVYGAARSAAARNYDNAAAAYQNASAHGGLPTYAQLQDYFSTVSGMAQATKNAAQQGVILPRNVRELENLRRGYAGMLQQSNWAKRLLNLTEDEYNTGYLYPSKYQNANRQTINENMARLKAVGDSGKGELNWLKENQYNYWTPDEIRKGIADTKNEIDLQKSQRRNNLILQDRLDKLRTASKTAATRDWDDLTRSNMEELARLTGHRSDSMRAGAAAQAMTPGTNNPILSAMTAHDAGKNDDRIRELYDYFRKKGYKDDEIAALAEYTLQNQHAQQRMKDLQELQEFGSRNLATRALSAAVSVPASVASGIGYTDLAAQAIGARQDPFTGERMRIDPYSGATGIGDAANVMRGAAIEGAPEPVKLAYNAFMSLADSYLAMQSGKGVTNVLLGGSAAMSTARSAFDRGASDWQALAAGGAAGIAEGLFEEFSIGRLRIMQATSATAKRTVKEFFLDWLKQGVTEGSEEGLTTLANTLTDAWIMGDKSELNTRIRELMAQNMSEEAATKQAYAEWAGQLGTDVLAGFLSGSMGNVVSGGLGSIERNAANFSTGQDIRKAGNMGAMIEQGLSAPEGSAAFIAAQRAQNAKEGSRRQARRVGETYQALQRGEARQAVQDRLEQLGAQNASETADAIMRQMQQQTLTSKQRKLLETKAAQRTMTEFSDAANGIEGSNTWASAAQARQFGRALQAFTQREREPQTIEAYSEKYGKTSAAVQQVYNMQPETDVQSFSNAFETAYALGREGANVEAAVTSEATQALTETQRRMAYDLGADAAKNGVHVELNSTLEGDNEYGGEIRVRAGGERNDGTRAAEPVRELAEGAEPAEGYRQAIAGSAKDSGASVLQYEAEAVSTQQIGITDGTRNRGIYLLKEDSPSTPAIDEARRIAKENGRNLVLFGGGNLQVREGGYVVSARGMYDPDTNTMFVRADHPEYDAGQIARHENGHGLIKEGKVSVKEVQRQMAKAMDDDAVKKALSDYANAYEGIDISDDALWEEIVCDALGDMNIFEGIDVFSEQAERAEQRGEAIRNAAAEMQNGRAPPEDNGVQKFSMETPVEETRDLIAVHNLTYDNLRRAAKLGGIPMPSIAIVKGKNGFNQYGPMSFVFHKDTIDPQKNRKNRIYGADAWTPTAANARVEYPIDSRKSRKFERKIDELSKKVANGIFWKTSVVQARGIDDDTYMTQNELAERLSEEDAVRAAYLADKGENIEPIMREVEYDSRGNEYLQMLIDRFGLQRLEKFAHDMEQGEWISDADRETMREIEYQYQYDRLKEKAARLNGKFKTEDFIRARAQEFADKKTDSQYMNFLYHAWEMHNGADKKTEVDRLATSNELNKKAPQRDVIAWLLPQIEEFYGEPGIYNGKDYYYPDGSRKTFKQLHWDYTLDNIVKAMITTAPQRGAGLWGATPTGLQSVSAPEYRSIAEVKADSGRLARLSEEEYDQRVKDVEAEISCAIEAFLKDNPSYGGAGSYSAVDSASSILIDIASKMPKSAADIKRIAAADGDTVTDRTAQRIYDTIQLAKDLPTDYFEAKPQRAIGFDEIAQAIIPANAPADVKNILNDLGVPVSEYEYNNDEDRTEKLNAVENVKFSRDLSALDKQYAAAVESGDMETAQRMVDEAAKRAGYGAKLYHGTDSFGFTKIDTQFSDDGFSFWAVDKEATAGTYTALNAVRRLTQDADSLYDDAMQQAENNLNDAVDDFCRLLDRTFSEWYFGGDYSSARDAVEEASAEIGRGDGVYDTLLDFVSDAYDRYGEDFLSDYYEDFAEWQENSSEWEEIEDAMINVESAKTAVAQLSKADVDNLGGIYSLFANTDDMFALDAKGNGWKNLRSDALPKKATPWSDDAPYSTREVAKWARDNGYKGVIYKNIKDNGQYGYAGSANVYAFFNPQSQVKSADPITYDDDGNIIPLSERFNPENADIRFSRDLESLSDLRRENRNLQKRLERAKAQTKLTTEAAPREEDVRRAARSVIQNAQSKMKVNDVAEDMTELAKYIMNGDRSGRNREPASWTEVKERAVEIARGIVDNASALSEGSDPEMYKAIRKYLRSTKLTLAEQDRSDMQSGYGEFVKKNFGTIRLGDGGIPVDTAYQEMQEEFGKGFFPDDITHPADQLMQIADVVNGLKPIYENPHTRYYDEAVEWTANAIIDELLGEDVRQNAPTYADRAEAKRKKDVAEAVAWNQYQAEQRENRMKEQYRQRMQEALQKEKERRGRDLDRLKLKQKFKESGRKERSARTRLWNKILDIKKDFRRMVEHPQQADSKHAPKRLAKALDAVTSCFNVEDRRRVLPVSELERALGRLQDVYKAAEKDDTLSMYYDENLIEQIGVVHSMLNEVDPFDPALDSAKLEAVYKLLRMCKHNVTTANQFITGKWAKSIIETGRKWAQEIAAASPLLRKGFGGQLLNYQLRPDSMFARFSGFAKNNVGEQVQRMFVDGTEKMLRIQQDFYYFFDKFSTNKEFDRLTRHGKNAFVDVGLKDSNGNAVKLTRDMMLALYMNLRSEDNLIAIAYGGADIPAFGSYYEGKTAKSFDDSVRTVSIDENVFKLVDEAKDLAEELQADNVSESRRKQIEDRVNEIQNEVKALEQEAFSNLFGVRAKIEKQLTKFEKQLVEAADQWMQKSADYINAETLAMYGVEKAQVEHYWPIHRNMNFVNTDMREATNEVNLENWGSLKERVRSHAPVKLTGFIFELDNHTQKMSQFCGFAAVQRDFNKLYQTRMPYQHSTLKEQISKKFGSDSGLIGVSGMEYIDNYIAAVSGGGNKAKPSVWSLARRNLPRATLSANFRVALSQVASVPTAAAEVGWGAMAKGFARYSFKGFSSKQIEALAKADPWFWQRSRGEGGMREFAESKESTFALDRAYNKVAGTKFGKVLLNWCQKFDMYATFTQYAMAEEWVKSNRKNLQVGSEAFQQAVSEKYRDILRKTQPNYTVTERSDLLRDNRESMKWATMYKTQSSQNLNVLYDATARLRQYTRDHKAGRNGVTDADVKEARQQFARAYTGVILGGTVTFVLFRALANALMHAMNSYRDDDDELTWKSFLNGVEQETFGAMSGMFLFGSEIEEMIVSVLTGKKYWGLSDSAISSVSKVAENAANLLQSVRSGEKVKENAIKLAGSLAAPLGLPVDNFKKIVNGVRYHIEDIQNGEFLSFEAGVDRTKKQQVSRFLNALKNGDTQNMQRIFDEMVKSGKAKDPEGATQSAIRDGIRQEFIKPEKGIKLSEDRAVELLQQYGGKSEEDAEKLVKKWAFEKDFGFKYDDLKDAYLNGNITGVQYKKALQQYGGKSAEDADAALVKIKAQQKYGDDVDITSIDSVVEAAIRGDISVNDAKAIWSEYNGTNEKTVEDRAEKLQFVIDHPSVSFDDVSKDAISGYNEHGRAAQISVEDYMEWFSTADDFSSDYDAAGKETTSRKQKIIDYINSLPITSEKKTAMYVSFYSAKKIPAWT